MVDGDGAAGVALDLLGDPIAPIRDPRGRPSYRKTPENQKLVMTLRGAGFSVADIAARLGCDEKTLRKHFSREIENGPLMLESLALQVLVKRMLDGSVGAAEKVLALARAHRMPKSTARPAPLGKKELRKLAAGQVPDDMAGLIERARQLH